MMKKIWVITGCLIAGAVLVSCNKVRRNTGRAYMPDMSYSRAYETYASTEALQKKGVHYNAMPVEGTIARGDTLTVYPYKNDSAGYVNSKDFANPMPALTDIQRKEATRLYLINCGICHGEKLDGNGPLYKGGDGPFPSKPATLVGDPKYAAMAEGTMFHSVTYGKNMMGSYASQLSTEQRWMIIHYIKEKQAASATTQAPVKDSTHVKDSAQKK